MGNVTSLLYKGISGGGADPQKADILNPATVAQANEQYGNVNTGLTQQQQFLQALQAQNGLQNQSDVYNQLNQMAQGQGPNPAQAMLANTTGANVANQAALMAGQRGASANPALIARQAAIQGGNIQQDAAGQAAALQAQQSANAINSMGNLATQQANQQANATNAYTNAAQNAYQGVTGNINAQNNANVGMQSNINNINADTAKQTAALTGNVMSAIGTAATGIPMPSPTAGGGSGASVGQKPMMAEGGQVPSGPKSAAGKFLHAYANGGKVDALVSPGETYLDPNDVAKVKQGANPIEVGERIPGTPRVAGAINSYSNDTVKKELSEGGIIIPRSITQSEDANKKAIEFVNAVLAKPGIKRA